MTLPDYAELHCISNFTFLRGASHPEELVTRAAKLGYRALAVTDECSLAGVVRAHQAAKEHGLHLIVGSELRLADGPAVVPLAMDRDGYANLSELITRARRRAPKGQYELRRNDLDSGLPGCLALLLPSPADDDETMAEQAAWLGARFAERSWIAAELLRGPDDAAWLERLETLSGRTGLPLAAAGGVHMHTRGRRTLQDVLTAIRLGTPVHSLGKALCPNGERHLRTRKRLAHVYPAALLTETVRIAERCTFSLDELRYEYPTDDVPPGETATAYLRRLTEAGLAERWPAGAPENVRALVEHELAVIAELGYEPYFLTVYDIVRFARSRGILCQGRGSAANSVVCYCLGITAVDPSRMEMLFERFVSKERNEPPDIDVDFEHERREEVIQYIYSRYGRERAALTATVITYRPKSALRDVGKALGFDAEQVERLADSYAWWDGREQLAERVREAGLDPASPLVQRLIELVLTILGFPRHLSQHVGGFVIARRAVSRLVPIENAAMAERSVIEWDKDDLDTMGLLKVDVLGLGMLSAIRRAFDLIARHRGRRLSLANIPPEDAAVYAMLSHADTVGVFQIESRAQMAMLPRLRPRTFYDLVIEVAIVRPGPIQGEMVHPYLRRRDGLEPVSYPSEAVRRVLERTLGVPIFQEQVIKLAVVAAGFSPGEADALRRAIGSWRRRDKLERFRQKLVDGMRERGYSEDFAQQIYNQIQGFGEYGFPESHAASFALLVYVSAWLKRYEPAAFACALLNSQPMGFYAPSQLVQDARGHGVEVRPVDVAHSGWDYTLEPTDDKDLALRLGLRQVKGVSKAGVERLVEARAVQAFHSVTDLTRRARLGRADINALAGAGALASLAGHRHHAHWQALGTETTLPLFGDTVDSDDTALLRAPTEGEDLVADYSSLGLTLGRHPLALLRAELVRRRCASSATLRERAHDTSIRIAGLVVTRQHPSSAKGVIFLTVEDETGSANVIVWPKLSERYRREVLNGRLLIIDGQVQREGEVIHVIARRLEDHSDLLGALPTQSRDFC
ncbi:MAG TPA: error-prone DNA polymerase [Gammaproteobacteria bacterium]|nr:error-prone DNA polymerase [Gammaproteobacteria bacterium]